MPCSFTVPALTLPSAACGPLAAITAKVLLNDSRQTKPGSLGSNASDAGPPVNVRVCVVAPVVGSSASSCTMFGAVSTATTIPWSPLSTGGDWLGCGDGCWPAVGDCPADGDVFGTAAVPLVLQAPASSATAAPTAHTPHRLLTPITTI